MSESRLKLVDEAPTEKAAQAMFLMALRALSERALIALSASFTLIAVGSAFWLWLTVLPNPNTFQLVGLGTYGLFVLAIEWIRRK